MWWSRRSGSTKDILDRLESLERRFSGLQLEWDDVYDKLRRTMSRVVKSRAKLEELDNGKETVEPSAQTASASAGTRHGLLTERQREIQQQILRRRAGG